jgi:hypothetical protein
MNVEAEWGKDRIFVFHSSGRARSRANDTAEGLARCVDATHQAHKAALASEIGNPGMHIGHMRTKVLSAPAQMHDQNCSDLGILEVIQKRVRKPLRIIGIAAWMRR